MLSLSFSNSYTPWRAGILRFNMRTLSNYFTNLFFVEKGARFAMKRKHIEKDVKFIDHILAVKYKDSIKVTCQIIPF
jgi:hypothetical protein